VHDRSGNYYTMCGAGTAATAAAAALMTLRLCDVRQALRIVTWCEFHDE
jgi:shikimate 5-dehydrogenase